MRGRYVVAAVVLAFAAGWLLRGCADERATPNDATPPAPARRIEDVPARPGRRPTTPARPGTEDADAGARPKPSDAPPPREEPRADAPPADDPRHPKEVTGVVVDRATGAPIEGVRIHLRATNDAGDLGWEGDRTDAEGRFSGHMLPQWTGEGLRLEVLAGRDGYHEARVPVAAKEIRVELEPWLPPPRPGRVVGVARAEDGKPLPGRLFLRVWDDLDLHSAGVWTRADENGRFTVDGLAPGHWRIALDESEERVDANVVEGADTPVELRGVFRDATGAFAAGELTEASFAREKAGYQQATAAAYQAARAAGKSEREAWDDPEVGNAGWKEQQLELQWLRRAPGRDVVVAGIAGADGAFVRLVRTEGAGCEWRAGIEGGAARFASAPFGKWRAVLVRPGGPDAAIDVDVKRGDGLLTVTMPALK